MPPAVLGEVFDGEPQPARPAGAEHEPVSAFWKAVVRQRIGKLLVVDGKVANVDAALRDAGRTPRFEDVHRVVGVRFRNPAAHRPAPQPLVFEVTEFFEIAVPTDRLPGIEVEARGVFEPEVTSGGRIEVPLHHVARVGVEALTGGAHGLVETVAHFLRSAMAKSRLRETT